MVLLEELQRSTSRVEESVHRAIISHALHKSVLYGREECHCWNKAIRCPVSSLPQTIWETEQTWEMRPKLDILALMQNDTSGRSLTLFITLITPYPPGNLAMSVMLWRCFLQQGQGNWSEFMGRWMEPNTGESRKKICYSLQNTWELDGVSVSTRTTTQQTQLQLDGLDQNMC